MPKLLNISKNETFAASDRITGYGQENAEGIDGQAMESYVASTVAPVAVNYNTTTNIITITLGDGTQILGTVET